MGLLLIPFSVGSCFTWLSKGSSKELHVLPSQIFSNAAHGGVGCRRWPKLASSNGLDIGNLRAGSLWFIYAHVEGGLSLRGRGTSGPGRGGA